MTEREQLILRAIIQHYLEFGESVGSRTLEKKYGIGVSSATIRNTMADLEEKGLITKTHTSSGRIPTNEAYKLYVDEIMKIRDVSLEIKERVVEAYNRKMHELESILQETSKVLSKISQYAAVVIEPSIKSGEIKNIRFVYINEFLVMAVVVLKNNLTKSFDMPMSSPMSEKEIENIEQKLKLRLNSGVPFTLNDFKHFCLESELLRIDAMIDTTRNSYIDEGRVFVEGGSSLLEHNITDVMKIINSAKLLNNPRDIKQILSKQLDLNNYRDGEVNIVFGEELGISGLEDFSFVFSVYTLGDAKGIMGVIGPKRMEYSKTVGLVEYVSEQVKELLKT